MENQWDWRPAPNSSHNSSRRSFGELLWLLPFGNEAFWSYAVSWPMCFSAGQNMKETRTLWLQLWLKEVMTQVQTGSEIQSNILSDTSLCISGGLSVVCSPGQTNRPTAMKPTGPCCVVQRVEWANWIWKHIAVMCWHMVHNAVRCSGNRGLNNTCQNSGAWACMYILFMAGVRDRDIYMSH